MFAKILSATIHERKIKKNALAAHLGIARSTLDAYLNNKVGMPSDLIIKTAKFIGCPVAMLFGETRQTDFVSLEKRLEIMQNNINAINSIVNSIAKSMQINIEITQSADNQPL